ncbi:MAG: hypothetical protein JRH20_07450 [Deltaproteobacteria bacterium]|nr:hypothetical protein [Deltaproteobacteria bacterium]
MIQKLPSIVAAVFLVLPLACNDPVSGPALPESERVSSGAVSETLGYVDGLYEQDGEQVLVGWACKRGSSTPIDVELWAGGPAGAGDFVARFAARSSSEDAVARACKTTGNEFRYGIPMDRCMRDVFGNKALYVYASLNGERGALLVHSGNFKAPAPINQAPALCEQNIVEEVVTHWDRAKHRVRFMGTGKHAEGAAELPKTDGTEMWWGSFEETADVPKRVFPYGFLPQPNRYRGSDFSIASPIYPLKARCFLRDLCRDTGVSSKLVGPDVWQRSGSEPKTRRVVPNSSQLQIVHGYRIFPTRVSERSDDLFFKPGNNGTVSCHRFCENMGSNWGKLGTCVEGELQGIPTGCDVTPGLQPNGGQFGCTCSKRYKKNLRGLVTIYLPPSWRPDAPSRYPIVFNGFYDLNQNVFSQEGPFMARLIADSSKHGKPGAIGILWNGGGAHTSYTMTPGAYDQFANIVDQVTRFLHGDRNRVFMFGGSRGGVTSLTMASNPDAKAYRVVFVSSAVPPAKIGQHLALFTPSMPSLPSVSDQVTGFKSSWRTGWRYPQSANNAFGGMTNVDALGRTLLGLDSDPGDVNHDGVRNEHDVMAWADEHQSLLSDRMLMGLKAAGSQVSLYASSFDTIVPSVHQFEYYAELRRRGIPVEGTFYVRAGHAMEDGFQSPIGTLAAAQFATYAALQRALEGGAASYVKDGQFKYLRVDRDADKLVSLVVPTGMFPFSLEFPRRVARGQRFSVIGVGTAGTLVRILAEPDDGSGTLVVDKGTSGQPLELESSGAVPAGTPAIGSFVILTGFSPEGPKVTYTIRVLIKEPGSTRFVELDNTNVPGYRRQAAILELVTDELDLGYHGEAVERNLRELISPVALGGSFRGISWGISQY